MKGDAAAGPAAEKGDLAGSAAAFTGEKGDTVFTNGESTDRGAEAAMPKGDAVPAFGACGMAWPNGEAGRIACPEANGALLGPEALAPPPNGLVGNAEAAGLAGSAPAEGAEEPE